MNLVTVYKAFLKQAAGEMPASPVGGVFKPQPLPPPISAPGAQAAAQPGEQAAVDPTATPDKSMQMLEKGWEKTMDTMKQMTAMNNGVPVAESGAAPAGPGMPGQPPMPPDGITPPQLPKMATVYKSMKKRATWLGRQVNNVFGGDTWMGRTFGESASTAADNFYGKPATAADYEKNIQAARDYAANYPRRQAVQAAQKDEAARFAEDQARRKAAKEQQARLAARAASIRNGNTARGGNPSAQRMTANINSPNPSAGAPVPTKLSGNWPGKQPTNRAVATNRRPVPKAV